MTRYAPYGVSKVGVNGVTARMQAMENDRVAQMNAADDAGGIIRFFSIAPGLLKTEFNNYVVAGIGPKVGAEVIVQLISDDQAKYEGGSQWEFVAGEMKKIPW